ncbi:hypothetical protein [Ralstonia mojiangensis]|uniref:hypothetical protein n=1 Tax=Ralstonia mojiangensis TaxID=2953895 RepID=UPI0020912B69|nr:hypothetical protein [Ralstonia mojiangensis]MCO5411030.1 hypothetical protein [Ralstonia mojiangensis]
MTHSAKEINSLCDKFVGSILRQDGSIEFNEDSEKYRLMSNGVNYPDLSFGAICAALSGTTRTLLLPRLNIAVSNDHKYLWAWCGQVIFNYNINPIIPAHKDLNLFELYLTALHAMLSGRHVMHPLESSLNIHQRQLLGQSTEILCHLSFPLLEALLKRACHQYVEMDGGVKCKFRVNGCAYSPGVDGNGFPRECSSIFDLLTLYLNKVKKPEETKKWALDN